MLCQLSYSVLNCWRTLLSHFWLRRSYATVRCTLRNQGSHLTPHTLNPDCGRKGIQEQFGFCINKKNPISPEILLQLKTNELSWFEAALEVNAFAPWIFQSFSLLCMQIIHVYVPPKSLYN